MTVFEDGTNTGMMNMGRSREAIVNLLKETAAQYRPAFLSTAQYLDNPSVSA
jgi:hypothetical protein